MKHLLALLLLVFSSSLCFTAEITKVSMPTEVKQEMGLNDADLIKNKQWNRWTSKNFVVCSLNDLQARYLHDNLENVKTWTYTRWGLTDFDFSAECRVICVDDKVLFKKLFNIDKTKIEVRKENNKVKMYVIFLLIDEKPSKTLPLPLTEICLAEMEQRGIKTGWWLHRGMSILNGTLPDIRLQLNNLYVNVQNNKNVYSSKMLFTLTEEQYLKETETSKDGFDKCALSMCLLLRKEFGQDKFLQFIKEANPETGLQKIYGFENYDKFDSSYKRYLIDLTSDVAGVRKGRETPDTYLQIKAK